MGLGLAIGLLMAVWLLLATFIRWGLRGLLAKRSATISWATGLLVSGGVIAAAAFALLRLAPVGEQPLAAIPPVQAWHNRMCGSGRFKAWWRRRWEDSSSGPHRRAAAPRQPAVSQSRRAPEGTNSPRAGT